MTLPKFMQEKKEPTRKASKRQETNISKVLKGKTSINSGATFHENDVLTDYAEVECKTTTKGSYHLKAIEFNAIFRKGDMNKIPVEIIEFSTHDLRLAVLRQEDLILLIDIANGTK